MTYGPTLTEAGFTMALNNAMPGQPIEYYRGFLAADGRAGVLPHIKERGLPPKWCFTMPWDFAVMGMITLTQRRHGDNDYSYFAVKLRKPDPLHPEFPAQFIGDKASRAARRLDARLETV